jgi:hypothetical protein
MHQAAHLDSMRAQFVFLIVTLELGLSASGRARAPALSASSTAMKRSGVY